MVIYEIPNLQFVVEYSEIVKPQVSIMKYNIDGNICG